MIFLRSQDCNCGDNKTRSAIGNAKSSLAQYEENQKMPLKIGQICCATNEKCFSMVSSWRKAVFFFNEASTIQKRQFPVSFCRARHRLLDGFV